MLKYVNCDLCGDNNTLTIFEGDSNCEAIVKCETCGFIYQNPRRDIPLDYSQWEAPEIEQAVKDFEKQYLFERTAKEITFHKILQDISKYTKGGRMLDVGSCYGFFLDLASKNGWEVYGIDPYTPAVEWSRRQLGLDVQRATLMESNFPDSHFDAVVMINVLEHVQSPSEELREVNRILKPQGLIFLEVPNVKNVWVRLLKNKWRYFLDVHYSHFDPASMAILLGKTGFDVRKVSTAPRIVSIYYLWQRMKQLGYLNSTMGPVFEKFLSESWIGKLRLKIDLRDAMRVFARKAKGPR